MKGVTVWIAMLALLAGVGAPALAQQAPAPSAGPSDPPAKTQSPGLIRPRPVIGSVKAMSAGSLVVVLAKTQKEETFVLDKDTRVMRGRQVIQAADLAANDRVRVFYTETDGKLIAKTVVVRTPGITGQPPTQSQPVAPVQPKTP